MNPIEILCLPRPEKLNSKIQLHSRVSMTGTNLDSFLCCELLLTNLLYALHIVQFAAKCISDGNHPKRMQPETKVLRKVHFGVFQHLLSDCNQEFLQHTSQQNQVFFRNFKYQFKTSETQQTETKESALAVDDQLKLMKSHDYN